MLSTFTKCVKDPNARLLVIGVNITGSIDDSKGKLKLLLSNIGIKSYYYQVLDLINKDRRIRCMPATYMLSNIMRQCYCNLSYFTIPHANLAMAECEIMGTPSIAAENPESIEYSLGGRLSMLYMSNSLRSFENAITLFDESYVQYKENLREYSKDIERLFEKEANVRKLNNVIDKML